MAKMSALRIRGSQLRLACDTILSLSVQRPCLMGGQFVPLCLQLVHPKDATHVFSACPAISMEACSLLLIFITHSLFVSWTVTRFSFVCTATCASMVSFESLRHFARGLRIYCGDRLGLQHEQVVAQRGATPRARALSLPTGDKKELKQWSLFLSWLRSCLGPPVVPFFPLIFFWGAGSPTKIDYRKKVGYPCSNLSSLEDLHKDLKQLSFFLG